MLEGTCQKCGFHCYGWSLQEEKYQCCPNCHDRLKIKNSIDLIGQCSADSDASKYLSDILGDIIVSKRNNNENQLNEE